MIEAVKNIGECIIENKSIAGIDLYIQNPNKSGNYNNVVVIILNESDESIISHNIVLEQYKRENIKKYLYRRKSSNGSNYSVTSLIAGDIEKTIKNRVLGWFKNYLPQITDPLYTNIYTYIINNSEHIVGEIKSKQKNIPSKEGLILTLKIKNNKEEKYITEYKESIEIFNYILEEKQKKSYAEDKICCLCGKKSKKVIGDMSIYKFYNIDKKGYITGGLNVKDAWKNFPVCINCASKVEIGRQYVETYLKHKFYGFSYELIPSVLWDNSEVLQEVLYELSEINKKLSLKNDSVKERLAQEEDILDLISDMHDYVTFNFLFVNKNQSEEKILLNIEDVFPSRINKIMSTKLEVEELYKYTFNFGIIRKFFIKSDDKSKNKDLDKYFLQLIYNIFKQKTVNKDFIIKFLIKRIRSIWVNNKDSNYSYIGEAVMVHKYLSQLKIIKEENVYMDERIFDSYFKQFDEQFSNPLKRGLVLLGVLIEDMLYYQRKNKEGNEPFRKNLKNLKMTEKDIKGLLSKLTEKFSQYNEYNWLRQRLSQEIAYYLLLSGDNWDMSIDEINFYLSAGICLNKEIKDILFNKEEKEIC